MEIVITIAILIALFFVIRGAMKSYQAEAGASLDSKLPDKSTDSLIFSDGGSSNDGYGHEVHHSEPGCVDSHHSGCDIGGHSGFDAGHGDFGGHH